MLRPRPDVEALIVRLAEENNDWGYKRISEELKKLGHCACPSYVRDVLRRHGLPPAPGRKGLSWKQFIQAHLEVTWATDFFAEEVWTKSGLVTIYVLFFLHLGTRRVWLAGCTPQPRAAWMAQQGRISPWWWRIGNYRIGIWSMTGTPASWPWTGS